ncbi:MAG: glycosyltransferase family 2 protein [Bacteroidota bacterium]
MLVTIGIPSYNRVESFERALQSAIQQTHTDLEILISKDYYSNQVVNIEIEGIAKKYAAADKRIRFIPQATSLRTVGSFSFLKNNANGKYFLWIADDDWIDSNYVETCVDFLEANPGYSLACGICAYHDIDGHILHTNSSFSIEQNNFWTRLFVYFRKVTLNGYYYGVLRTNLIKEFPIPDQVGFDWSLVAYLCFKGKLKTITTTVSHIAKGGVSNESSNLSSYFAKQTYLSKKYLGLSCSLNCAGNVFHSGVYDISWIKKLMLSILIFISSYSNTIQWDVLFVKRRVVKFLRISPDGVIKNRKRNGNNKKY